MARPSEASTPGGTCSRNVVRYHATPGRGSELGSVTPAQRWSGKPGRYQPARSPYRPPLLSGPRTRSRGASTPPAVTSSVPWMRQVTAGEAPVKVTLVRPRACLKALFAPPSSWCDIGRTSTASRWFPASCAAAGIAVVTVDGQPWEGDWLDVGVG